MFNFNKIKEEGLKVVEIQSTFNLILIESHINKLGLNLNGGWGNGYVGLPHWHPLFNIHYDEIEDIYVHGGLTYSDYYDDTKNLWVIGFDTNHYNSLSYTYDRVLEETFYLQYQCLNIKGVKEKLRLEKIKNIYNE